MNDDIKKVLPPPFPPGRTSSSNSNLAEPSSTSGISSGSGSSGVRSGKSGPPPLPTMIRVSGNEPGKSASDTSATESSRRIPSPGKLKSGEVKGVAKTDGSKTGEPVKNSNVRQTSSLPIGKLPTKPLVFSATGKEPLEKKVIESADEVFRIDETISLDLPVTALEAQLEIAEEPVTTKLTKLPDEGAPEVSDSSANLIANLQIILQQELEHVPAPDQRKRAILYFEMGHLADLVFHDSVSALKHYESAFGEDPSLVPIHRALRRHYAIAGRWADYLKVLQEEVISTADAESKAELLTHQGEILASRLDDIKEAVKKLRAALSLDPRNRRAAEVLRSLFARQQRWNDLLEVLRFILNITNDSCERGQLMVEMAEIYEFRLGKATEAEELYLQALTLDFKNESAVAALKRLFLSHRRWKELAELLAQETGRNYETEERFADLYRAARIFEMHLQDDVRAASLLESASALKSQDPLPLHILSGIYQRLGRYEDWVETICRLLPLVQDPLERANLCYRLGQVYQEWLEQPTEAMNVYRAALKEQPDHEASMQALLHLLERLEHWEELLDLKLLQAERAPDSVRRAEYYLSAAEICESHLNDVRRAIEFYNRAFQIQPGLPSAFRALQRLYHDSKEWSALAGLYERQAENTKDRYWAISLIRSAAWIYEETLDNPNGAILLLEKLLRQEPNDRETLINLARLYEESNRMEDLCRALESWSAMTEDDQERTEIRRHIGAVLEGPLNKPEQALAMYRGILKDIPSDLPTVNRLKSLFEKLGRWSDLLSTLRHELTFTLVDAEQALLLTRIGILCRDKLGDVEEAQKALQEALKADPKYTPALVALKDLLYRNEKWDLFLQTINSQAERTTDSAIAAVHLCGAGEICERYLADKSQAERFFSRALEIAPNLSPAQQGLERLYLTSQDWSALASHYLREAEQSHLPLMCLRAYLRLGALFDGPGNDLSEATTAYESALRVVENQPDVLRAITGLFRRQGDIERLVTMLPRIAGTTRDREAAIAALEEWADIVDVHLHDQWDPAPIYERILEAEPDNVHALFALDTLAYARNDTESLASLALKQIRHGGSGEWIASLAIRAAVLLHHWNEGQEATRILRAGLESCPDYLPLIQFLRQLDQKTENWEEAAELFLKEGRLASNKEAAHSALIGAGDILLERFRDEKRARAAFERVIDENPGNEAAFTRMVSLLSATKEWIALIQYYQRRLETLNGYERIPLLLDLSALYRDKFQDNSAAIDTLKQVLTIEPSHLAALIEISTLCHTQRRWRDAEEYLAQLASAAKDDPVLRRKAGLERSELLAEQLGDANKAMEVLQDLLDEFPNDREALHRTMLFYQHQGNWEKTVQVLEELARTGPPTERVTHLVNLAEIWTRHMDDAERAQVALRKAGAICTEHGMGIERITEYFERRGDFEGLAKFFSNALKQLPPEGTPASVPVRLALARILAGRMLRPTEAEHEIRLALQSDPNSVSARLELANLQLWGDNFGEASTEFMTVLEQDPFSLEAFRGLYRVYERRGDIERAVGASQAICAIAGRDIPERKMTTQALASFEALIASASNVNPLGVHEFWHLLAHPDEPPVGRELLLLIADYIPQFFSNEVERSRGGSVIPLTEEDPLAHRCYQLAQILGVERFECCIGQHFSGTVSVLPGVPPRLVVDETFANQSSASEFRFATGRALALILTRSLYLSVLPPRSVELMLAAIVEIFERGYGESMNQPQEVEELARIINRAVPRRVRKILEEPAHSYAAGQPVTAGSWYVASQRSAERAGLLLAGDTEAALSVLNTEKASRTVQAELLRFSVGPHLCEARRRMGITIF